MALVSVDISLGVGSVSSLLAGVCWSAGCLHHVGVDRLSVHPLHPPSRRFPPEQDPHHRQEEQDGQRQQGETARLTAMEGEKGA